MHLSLAILEVLVHLEIDVDELPDDYVSVEIDVPDGPQVHTPDGDIDIYDLGETRSLGDQWAASMQSVALEVPSAVVPRERNVCLNPAHPDFRAIGIVEITPFRFDPRLFDFG